MRTTVFIENLGCENCKKTVLLKLKETKGISKYDINLAAKRLRFDFTTHNVMEGLREDLSAMGYPISAKLRKR